MCVMHTIVNTTYDDFLDKLIYNSENECEIDSKITFILPKRYWCYLLKSCKNNHTYIGYTTDFEKRLRQHNGEISGGAKKTRFSKPWKIVALITGFIDNHMALRFEFRWQRPPKGLRGFTISKRISSLNYLISQYDKGKSWPKLSIYTFII